MLANGIRVKEERSTNFGLSQEIRSEGSNPFKDRETSAGFQDKESNGLLDEKSNDDSRPGDEVALSRGSPETELEDEETEDGDGTIAVLGVLHNTEKIT